jgi:hypothetical protein
MGTGILSPWVKRPGGGGEADHAPSCSAEIKNAWSYISTAPIRLHGVVFSKVTFTLHRNSVSEMPSDQRGAEDVS